MHDGRQFEPSAPITSEKNNELPPLSPPFGIFFVMGHRERKRRPRKLEKETCGRNERKERKRGALCRVKEEERRFVREERKRTEEEEPHASDLHTWPAGCAMRVSFIDEGLSRVVSPL